MSLSRWVLRVVAVILRATHSEKPDGRSCLDVVFGGRKGRDRLYRTQLRFSGAYDEHTEAPMTDRHAMLTAIRENPSDDTPRLVYADWLEEHGEPERAELVRVGCELRGLVNFGQDASVMVRHFTEPRKSELTHAVALQGRERELAAANAADWLPSGFGYLISTGSATKQDQFVIINSGISVDVLCPWELWREHGDLIWERELPWKVRLTTEPTLTVGGNIEYVGQTGKAKHYRVANRIAAVPRRVALSRLDYIPRILTARWPGITFKLDPLRSAINFLSREPVRG